MKGIDIEKVLSDPSQYDEIANILANVDLDLEIDDLHQFGNAMTQIFGSLAKSGRLFPTSGDKIGAKTAEWIKEQIHEYENICIALIRSEDPQVSHFAFELLMKLVMIQGKYGKMSYDGLIEKIIAVQLDSDHDVLEECWTPYIGKYNDICFYFLRALAAVIEEYPDKNRAKDKLIDIYENFNAYPQSDYDLVKWFCGTPKITKNSLKSGKGNLLKVGSHKSSAQKAWMAFLNLPLNATDVKRILTVLHANAIPNVAKPQLLMDFLTDSYNYGGPVALLALNSLFLLIQEYNLDYPNFFKKLYLLLGDGSLFASTHRARFLRLLDLFLTSTHLPGAIPASIIKRMARLSLFSPPGAIVAIIPFIYNQLKRHPTCMVMIHRNLDITGPETDPFDTEDADPLSTRAIESSLWELEALTHHYQPNVSALARIFSQPFHKPYYHLEHFLTHSYETLYSAQQKRKGNGGAALEYEEVQVFSEDGFLSSWTT